jgi:hypothetical protein
MDGKSAKEWEKEKGNRFMRNVCVIKHFPTPTVEERSIPNFSWAWIFSKPR